MDLGKILYPFNIIIKEKNMTTGYAVMKTHFDRLLTGNYSNNYFRGAEPIRSTYLKAFGKQINMYNIHETAFRVDTNPNIKSLISIVGPITDDRDLPEGIMMCDTGLAHVSVFTSEINRGINAETVDDYVNSVYNYMNTIIRSDSFYQPDSIARDNPYMKLVRMLPFYFTYFHIRTSAPEYSDHEVFALLLEKYLVDGAESIEKLLNYLSERQYSSDMNLIYNSMTVNGEIDNDLLY